MGADRDGGQQAVKPKAQTRRGSRRAAFPLPPAALALALAFAAVTMASVVGEAMANVPTRVPAAPNGEGVSTRGEYG